MTWMRMVAMLVLAGQVSLLQACDQRGSGDHMMGDGMMGQMSPGNIDPTLPEQQSEGAQLFRRHCGLCHAPPAPAAHTAREWPQVVFRMKQRMTTQGMAVPDSEQLQEIIAYLQRHAQ